MNFGIKKRIGAFVLTLVLGLIMVCGNACAASEKKVQLSSRKLTMVEGKTKKLSLKNAKAKKVTWKSADKKVATVSSAGLVRARKKGKTRITATYKKKSYTCTVTVKKDTSDKTMSKKKLKVTLGGTPVSVDWEENASVEALEKLVAEKPLSISMSMYGGFEQVGSIGKSIARDDKQMTTSAGDLVLYAGDQIVVFYGSNTWSYTKLGHISDKSKAELTELLGNGDITLTISQ